jgi:trans-2,3-dihydro-3-hydroxyanthranilate isomerase
MRDPSSSPRGDGVPLSPEARGYTFRIVDVFAEKRFGGNQLAVFPEARGLSDDEMQAIAREFNFAESTFVLPPDDAAHTARVRIFTPRTELPFAGHPTLGTAAVLTALGRGRAADGGTKLVLEERVGPIDVVVQESATGHRARLSLNGAVERPGEQPDVAGFARALSLPPHSVVDAWFAAVGPRFAFARLASHELVDAAVLDRPAWQTAFGGAWTANLYFFAGQTSRSGRLYARMFAPGLGIDEDPATGSAAASLVASLAARTEFAGEELRLHIDQGVALGRPSLIEAVAEKKAGQVRAVHVAGNCVHVADGTWH